MIKVLHVLESLDRNGKETFIMNVFQEIDREKVMFDFLLFSSSLGGYYDDATALGANIHILPARRDGYLKYLKSLNFFFQEHGYKYKVIHYHVCSLTAIAPLVFAKKYDIPIRIIHSHNSGWQGIHNYVFHHLKKIFLPLYANRYIACSSIAAEWCFCKKVCNKQTIILKNGIDLQKFSFNEIVRNFTRQKFKIEDQFVIGHVGRFTIVKNQSYLIDLFIKVLEKIPNATLILIGTGELENFVKEKVKKNNLIHKVIFLGAIRNVNELVQAMDCFIFPSLYEGLPFSLIEAQASGLPILTTDTVSRECSITNNIDFLKLDSPLEWLDRIKTISVEFKRQDMSSSIKEAGFSINDSIVSLLKIYNNENITYY